MSNAVEERILVKKLQTQIKELQKENLQLKNNLSRFEGCPDMIDKIRSLEEENAKLKTTRSELLEEEKSKRYIEIHAKWLKEYRKTVWLEKRFKVACERFRILHDQYIAIRRKLNRKTR